VANYNGDMQRTHSIIRKLPGPPQLLCSYGVGPLLLLSWTTNSPDFVLQSATTLTNGGDWQDATNSPSEINGQRVVTVDAIGSSGFFRLRAP